MKKRIITVFFCLLLILFVFSFKKTRVGEGSGNITGNFTIDIIKKSDRKENYLVSPYSIKTALYMLKEGSSSKTEMEFNNYFKEENIKIENDNVKIANAIFIRDIYKNYIEKAYTDKLKNNYNSEILYDEFKSPDIINNWVKLHTDGMIEKVIDEVDKSFVFGLANAIAIDVKWKYPFDCSNTYNENFYVNKKTLEVEMMHKSYENDIKYLDKDVKGIIIPYEEKLEFVALMPKDIGKFINSLSYEELNSLIDSFNSIPSSTRVNLSIPRFNYDFSLDNFKEILISLGFNTMFDSSEADFSKVITKDNLLKAGLGNLYVSDAIHKTYIDLNENGTRAAAVTYFGIKASGAFTPNEYKNIDIKFDKPFIYLIRDVDTHEILFFGSVYKPSKWSGSTCKNGEF